MGRLLSCRVALIQSKFGPLALWSGAGRIRVATVQPQDICRNVSATRRRNLELKNLARFRAERRHVADDCGRSVLGVEHTIPMREAPSECLTKTLTERATRVCISAAYRISYTLYRLSTGNLSP